MVNKQSENKATKAASFAVQQSRDVQKQSKCCG